MPEELMILASNSPRRHQLIALGGWKFGILAAEVDESPFPDEAPDEYVMRLAQHKANACMASLKEGKHIIVAADTTVAAGKNILGKPKNNRAAEDMLKQLRGRTHQVYSGLAVLRTWDENLFTDLCTTDVTMRDYTDTEIHAYVASGDPLDKAGAYAIQHAQFHPVERLSGCYASVMGMPLCHLARTLHRIGVSAVGEVPANCQAALNYQCPIHHLVLSGEKVN